ncbi:DNA replication/repair protein RecF [Halochromatium sp.]
MLRRLKVERFRNLRGLELELGTCGNWVVGSNAAGKTAVLEAVYCMSRGRSFRGRRFGSLVQRGACSARVEGWIEEDLGSARLSWVCADGEVRRAPEGSGESLLPVRLICEWTHALVDGEPALRRRFVDWNLMLWDRSAVDLFSRFRRVAAQRNAWLRAGGGGRAVWDEAYADALADILKRRAGFFAKLSEGFSELNAKEGWFVELEARWDGLVAGREELLRRLQEMRAADQERGFTYLGITRADFSLRCDGLRWVGSRGQAKVLGCILQVVAEQLVSESGQARALWLVDDLDAELAPEWTEKMVGLLRKGDYQALYTALPGKLGAQRSEEQGDRMFHVEQGVLSRGTR